MKGKNRKRKSGWAHTKRYPHGGHPANYKRNGDDLVEYITFTHSPEVELYKDRKVQTVPLKDNISVSEREENRRRGLKAGENRSYAYPKVFVGKRSALGKEVDGFNPTVFDKLRIEKMFKYFDREQVSETGGMQKYKKKKMT